MRNNEEICLTVGELKALLAPLADDVTIQFIPGPNNEHYLLQFVRTNTFGYTREERPNTEVANIFVHAVSMWKDDGATPIDFIPLNDVPDLMNKTGRFTHV